ncbi:HD domain-containing protein [Paradesulfitobacterium aromaticivorans]
MAKLFEIRDPIYGFIQINDWEREIINDPVFQRLRRIKQLAFTDMVYPGACHSRFEHSLGVLHVATRMFDAIVEKEEDFLRHELDYEKGGLERDRVLLRLSCLLHDIGHSPFSHAGEDLMVSNPRAAGASYTHEDYSAAIVRFLLKDTIEKHRLNENWHIKAEEVAQFIEGNVTLPGRALLWRSILSSQLDADRADYLLRDSHHCGVAYGQYDLNRLLVTLAIGRTDTESPVLAVEQGGIHATEALILARYQMFTQVYFQHTRRAYDHHVSDILKDLLAKVQSSDRLIDHKDKFPPPTTRENVSKYVSWDDWKVMGLVTSGEAGPKGEIVQNRRHYRAVHQTVESPSFADLELFERVAKKLDQAEIPGFSDNAEKSWYKIGEEDILVCEEDSTVKKVVPLSNRSSIVKGLSPVRQQRVYVPLEYKERAKKLIKELKGV